MITLFVQYYDARVAERQKEIDLCLSKNIENDLIDRIVVIVEGDCSVPVGHRKLQLIRANQRPTYRDWLEHSRIYAREGLIIFANSDIYFDKSLDHLRSVFTQPQTLVALSRWDLINGKEVPHENPRWSQDTWAIHSVDVDEACQISGTDIPIGVPRCDNKLAYVFAISGWRLVNCMHHVRSIHVHETNHRSYEKLSDDRIIGGVAYVAPVRKLSDTSELDLDVWIKKQEFIREIKLNNSLEKWQANNPKIAAIGLESKDIVIETARPTELLRAVEAGSMVSMIDGDMEIYAYSGDYYFKNGRELEQSRVVRTRGDDSLKRRMALDSIGALGFIPNASAVPIRDIRDKPISSNDCSFWQYPAATEKLAFENHRSLPAGENSKEDFSVIHTYIGLPWATYIDKRIFPEEAFRRAKALIGWYSKLTSKNNQTLKVHTCCQHIHWHRMVEYAVKVGITDLHISHKWSKSDEQLRQTRVDLKLHAWPLIAVNYEVKERSYGLEVIEPSRKSVLASFIGAHMDHYLDTSRLQLLQAAKSRPRDDVIVELNNEWHFNKHVYQEQVHHKALSMEHVQNTSDNTCRYNSILSASKFSLCPVGAGPNTLRLWESCAIGAVPVLFSTDLSVLHELPFSRQLLTNCVIWEQPIDPSLFEYLDSIPPDRVAAMQEALISLYPSIARITCFGGARELQDNTSRDANASQ